MRLAKACFAVTCAAVSTLRADVLYSNLPSVASYDTTGQVASQTYTRLKDPSNGQPFDIGSSIGDDYNTGYSTIDVTSLTFYGGADPTRPDMPGVMTGDRININFYTANGTLSTTLDYSAVNAEVAGNGLHTINFPTRTIPGNGFITFTPQQITLVNAVTGARVGPYPGSPVFYTDWGRAPTVGASDGGHYITVSANSGQTIVTVRNAGDTINPVNGNTLAPVGGVSSSFLQFQLSGTGNGTSLLSEWTNPLGGTWENSGSWTPNAPNAVDAVANFRGGFGAIAGPVTVTVDSPRTVGTISFDNASAYTIAGTKTLTVNGSGFKKGSAINVSQGSHVISAPVILARNTSITVMDAAQALDLTNLQATTFDLNKAGLGVTRVNAARVNGLNISGGSVQVISSGADASTSIMKSLVISPGASLNLNDNKLVLDYTGTSPIATVQAMIKDGRIHGGTSLPDFGIGYGEASVLALSAFGGVSVDGTAILVRRTLRGDADLNGIVNFDDLVPLAQNYNGTSKVWTQGDFDYDNVVNFDDLVPLAQNYNKSLTAGQASIVGPTFAADYALAQALVPEPSALAAAVGVVAAARSRRSRCV